ncbi:MAG: NFACT family protein [Fimbriimonadaceae bacterium]|nr:NFACT family protein [Fimbriimonadaceae bacterium]
MKRIPFDSLCLAAAVDEMQTLVGGKLQKILGLSPLTVHLGVYKEKETYVVLSAHPDFARAHIAQKRPPRGDNHQFALDLRRKILDARLEFVRQRGRDRILEMGFIGAEGAFQLVAELMGKHSNLMLVDETKRVVCAAKWVGTKLSRRPILPGQPYLPPPFEPRPVVDTATPGDELKEFEGASPFLISLMGDDLTLDQVQEALRNHEWRPEFAPGYGVYPLPIHGRYPSATPVESFGLALERHFNERVSQDENERQRQRLQSILTRVVDARAAALSGVDEAREAARLAPQMQIWGELILAYQGSWKGEKELRVWDYEGVEVLIPMDPEKSAVENAERLFRRAKRAKERANEMDEQADRLRQELITAQSYLVRVLVAESAELSEIEEDLDRRRWKHQAAAQSQVAKEERPFGGHSIKELLSPGGWRVLYGENATSNDYLTTKVARPNDYWFHVRGGVGSHVVLATDNQPTRVQMPDLMYAAMLAKRNSPSKHSDFVAVDCTLKKYVRKPRGSAPGFAAYTHERTLHVQEDGRR